MRTSKQGGGVATLVTFRAVKAHHAQDGRLEVDTTQRFINYGARLDMPRSVDHKWDPCGAFAGYALVLSMVLAAEIAVIRGKNDNRPLDQPGVALAQSDRGVLPRQQPGQASFLQRVHAFQVVYRSVAAQLLPGR